MNSYRFRLDGVCPVDGSTDRYDVVVLSESTIPVERILEVARNAVAAPVFQEDLTAALSTRLGDACVTTYGTHSGVVVVSHVGRA